MTASSFFLGPFSLKVGQVRMTAKTVLEGLVRREGINAFSLFFRPVSLKGGLIRMTAKTVLEGLIRREDRSIINQAFHKIFLFII